MQRRLIGCGKAISVDADAFCVNFMVRRFSLLETGDLSVFIHYGEGMPEMRSGQFKKNRLRIINCILFNLSFIFKRYSSNQVPKKFAG